MQNKIPAYLLSNEPEVRLSGKSVRRRFSFLDRTIISLARKMKAMYLQAETSSGTGFLARLNPVTKVLSFVYLIILISIIRDIQAHFLICLLIFSLYVLSGVRIIRVYKKALIIAFIFGFLIFLPAALNIITPGDIIVPLIRFDNSHHFWIYNIPKEIGFTMQGGYVVVLLFLRVLNSVSLALLLVYNTSFPRLLKALKVFFVPDTILMVISLAYKYIYVLCKTLEEAYLALRSRLMGNIQNKNLRGVVAGRVFFIYKRSRINYEQTYMAMLSRGYAGKVVLVEEERMKTRDLIILMLVILAGLLFIFI
jgi:cobalt/nickel transport system permease protein